jgi:hypothetical protein
LTRVITVEKVADLELSAASGLVRHSSSLLVVADDETVLDRYAAADGQLLDRVPLLPRAALPEAPAERKAAKPDFEALAWLPDGRLLVLGSGSTPVRRSGIVLLAPGSHGGSPRDPREVDMTLLYLALQERLPALNVEGAAVAGGVIRLLHRGGAASENAIADLDLDVFLRFLDGRGSPGPDLVRTIRTVSLGSLAGVPLGFTDASPVDRYTSRIAFAAAAEDTRNAYDDGPCAGSVIGLLDGDGRVAFMAPVDARAKIEGLAVGPEGLLMVADPDDRAQRAPLFRAPLPRW